MVFCHLPDILAYKHYFVFPVSLTTFYVLHWCIGACDLTSRISDIEHISSGHGGQREVAYAVTCRQLEHLMGFLWSSLILG